MNTMTRNPLVQTLAERQVREGWSDQRMADELGMTRPNWSFLRSGRHNPSMRTVKRIVTRFPEYTNLALFFLLPDVTHSDRDVVVSDRERVVAAD